MKTNHLVAAVLLMLSPGFAAAETAIADKPDGSVGRAQFTSEVVDREPVDQVTFLENDHEEILFFTEIRQMSGRTVTHRWEYQGEVMAEISFEVGGPRWRVYSSKTLLPDQLGKWTVVVVDQSGWPMHAEEFEYRAAVPESQPAEVPQAPQDLTIPVE